jgi:tartrate-resistant acid phosphatase type 5
MRKLVFAVLAVWLGACGSTSSTVTKVKDAASPLLPAVPGDICAQLKSGTEVPVIPVNGPLRVLAFGDFGAGTAAQKRVARGMAQRTPYSFGITLGDNFYNTGLSSPTDKRWQTRWEDLYSPLNIRVYATLGNHDYLNRASPDAEIARSSLSRTWCLPRRSYTFVAGPVQFFAIDTDPMERKTGSVSAQLAWLQQALAESKATWKVVYGHHPVYTNGEHGGKLGLIPEIKRRLLPVLKGKADVYLAGHDHDLEALQPDGGVWFFVSGGGGQDLRPLKTSVCRQWAESMNGFTVLEADGETLTMSFYDADGKVVKNGRVELKKGAPAADCSR